MSRILSMGPVCLIFIDINFNSIEVHLNDIMQSHLVVEVVGVACLPFLS